MSTYRNFFSAETPFPSILSAKSKKGSSKDFVSIAASHAATSDAELVKLFIGGDQGTFPVLVERHVNMVYKFVYRYLNNVDDSNDVVQEVFIKVWKYINKFDTDKNFKTWLLTIAKNTALDFIKKRKPLLFSKIEEGDNDLDTFLAPYVQSPELPDSILERKHLKKDLEKALDTLSPSYRSVLTLRYTEHLKFREIAEILQEPIDTVKSKHRRGLVMLRTALEK